MSSKNLLILNDFRFLKIKNISYYQKVYTIDDLVNKIESKYNVKCNSLSKDIRTIHHMYICDYEALKIGDRIVESLYGEMKNNPLISIGGEDFARIFVKKRVLFELWRIIYCVRMGLRVMKKEELNNIEVVSDLNFSHFVYKALEKEGLIPENVSFQKDFLSFNSMYTLLKEVANFVKFSISTLKPFIQLKGSDEPPVKIHKKIGILTADGIGFETYPFTQDFITHSKYYTELGFKKEDLLFIVSEKELPADKHSQLKNSGYSFVNFFCDLKSEFSKLFYFKKIFFKALKLQASVFLFSFKMKGLMTDFSNLLHSFIDWEFYFHKYRTDVLYTIQHPSDLMSVIFNKNRGVKTYFIYHGTTHNRIERDFNDGIAEEVYYSHLIFDKNVGCKASNDWFRRNQCIIDYDLDYGPLMADFIHDSKSKKKQIKEKFNIPEDKKIVSAFDQNIGTSGVLTYEDSIIFFRNVLELAKRNEDYFVIIKMKRFYKFDEIKFRRPEIIDIFGDIRKHERILIANESELVNYDLIAISDLVISSPICSITMEAWVGGVPSLIFDPSNRYAQDFLLTELFEKLTAHNPKKLHEYTRFWVSPDSKTEFDRIINECVKKYYNEFCDGQGIKRLLEDFKSELSN